LAEYLSSENFTTRIKIVDFSKARKDLQHDPKVDIHTGIKRYVEWMKTIYCR